MKGINEELRVRTVFSCVGVAVGLFGLWHFTGGELDGSGVLFFVTLLAGPFGLYVLGLRTRQGSWSTGIALICLVVVIQLMVTAAWERGSSTAPIGYLWLPVAGAAVVAIGALVERWRE